MLKAIGEGIFPGAALLVASKGEVVFREFFGNATLIPSPEPVTEATLFDIASLTKPVATASILLRGSPEKELPLNGLVSTYLPEFDAEDKRRIKINHLLKHTSGLPSWKPYFEEIIRENPETVGTRRSRFQYVQKIAQETLEVPLAYQKIYSDLGFILLGILIEDFWETPLDKLFLERIAAPLGLNRTFYLPVGETRTELVFAATEQSSWRKRLLRGEVHDDNAYTLGGVAGHAGLFSTVDDLHLFLTALERGSRGKEPLFRQETVLEFIGPRVKWKLGWDAPDEENSQAGRWFSRNSVGHLGYTGCSFWVDLDQDFHVILLTNRVHPTSRNDTIRGFRPIIHDLIYEEIICQKNSLATNHSTEPIST